MPKYFIVSYRNDLLNAKKLSGKAISLELRAYSKREVLYIYQSSHSIFMKTIKKSLLKPTALCIDNFNCFTPDKSDQITHYQST